MIRFILVLFIFSLSFAFVNYDLELEISTDKIHGKAVINFDEPVNVTTDNLKVISYKKAKKQIQIIFEKNISFKDEIFLTGNFYPQIDKLAKYSFRVKLPDGFIPVSQAEKIVQKDKWFYFYFPYPLEEISLIARKDFKIEKLNGKELEIYGYFFKNGSKELLKNAYRYIQFYQKKFGKFPYKRFSIVETGFPYGFSFPTFTTINSYIINKPFIINPSLAHEILHQWFGCSVYVDFQDGNWSEGLVTFFSNYEFTRDKRAYRKTAIQKYEAFWEKDIPLKNFLYKRDMKWEALGYGKGMFFFFMLSNYIGKENLEKGLKYFYEKNRFKRADWKDIQKAVSLFSPKKVNNFFKQWVYEGYVPYFQLQILSVKYKINHFETKVRVIQGKNFFVMLPVVVETKFEKKDFTFNITKQSQIIILNTKYKPLKIYIDPDYKVFRHLSDTEFDPLIYNYISKRDLVKNPTHIKQVEDKNIVFTDLKNKLIEPLIGRLKFENEPFLRTFRNPLGNKKTITIMNNFPEHLIKHYGNYSDLYFTGRKIKKISKLSFYSNPIYVYSGNEYIQVNKGATNFKNIISLISKKRAIFIGENHPVFSNHISELEIIKGVYEKNKNITIGMEIFQKPFQKYIDDYINGKIDEITFLLKTQYYKRWGYDYRLYKPIIDFAKGHKIRIIALNAPSEIIEKVSKYGLKGLSEDEIRKLPEIDFSNIKYKNLLRNIFKMHEKRKNFTYFYESQLIWDETMADTAYKNMNDKNIIVLAGNGHLRYGYGIPSRFQRRSKIKPVVILNDDEVKPNISDFVVENEDISYEKSPKLGVYIKETKTGLKVLKVIKGSLAQKIGLKKGDLIIKYNDNPVNKVWVLKTFLTFLKPEDKIVVLRKGQKIVLHMRI